MFCMIPVHMRFCMIHVHIDVHTRFCIYAYTQSLCSLSSFISCHAFDCSPFSYTNQHTASSFSATKTIDINSDQNRHKSTTSTAAIKQSWFVFQSDVFPRHQKAWCQSVCPIDNSMVCPVANHFLYEPPICTRVF